jgi:hypothetical protein
MRFTIYDSDAARIILIEKNLQSALSTLGLKGIVMSITEPPFLAREQLLDQVPVIEHDGKRWSLGPGKTPGESELIRLLKKLTNPEA